MQKSSEFPSKGQGIVLICAAWVLSQNFTLRIVRLRHGYRRVAGGV